MDVACSSRNFRCTSTSLVTRVAILKCPRCFKGIDMVALGFLLDETPDEDVTFAGWEAPKWRCQDCGTLHVEMSYVGCADGRNRDLCGACAEQRLDEIPWHFE